MHINDRRIRFLFRAWKCGSMRAAAELLDLAPSSISRQIALLESEIGASLIEHGHREVRLTEAGRSVVNYYMDQLSSQEALRSHLLDLAGMRTGQIHFALGEGFLGPVLYAMIDEFQDRYPGFTLSVRVTDTTEMLRLLAQDEVHFGLAFHPPSDPQIRSQFRAMVPLKAILHKDHPLAGRKSISIVDLAQHPLALMDERFRIRQIIDMAANDAQQIISPALTTNSIAILVRSACAGRTSTILPEFSARAELDNGGLVAVAIKSDQLQSVYLHVITRHQRQLSPAVLAFMQQVRARLGPLTK